MAGATSIACVIRRARRGHSLVSFAALVLAGCAAADSRVAFNDALRVELLEMRDADQRVRGAALRATNFHGVLPVDSRILARLKEIVDQHGWPGKSLVGEDGANAAWALVQHAYQDPGFMRRARGLMERAVKRGEASARDYAFLVDRVRLQQGKGQLYGTQFVRDSKGRLILQPLKDPEEVDERRAKMGLSPFAVYEAELRQFYKAK